MQHLLLDSPLYEEISLGSTIYLDKDNGDHLIKSLRMKEGERLSLANGRGGNYLAEIEEIDGGEVALKILEKDVASRELPIDIHIYQGMPKGDKLEMIVQKSTELGAVSLTPVHTKRSVALIKKDKQDKKVKRYQKIADNAANQSKRQRSLRVNMPLNYNEAIKSSKKFDRVILAYEEERGYTLKRIRKEVGEINSLAIFIGPEGGFDEKEVELARELGVFSVSLGARILRTETAALAMLSYLMLVLEE